MTDNTSLTGATLLIDALQANGLNNMYGVVGIPITNLARLWEQDGQKFYSFRHEQHAGYAASIAGYIQGDKPGVCLTVSAPGFLNGLTALAHATTNCFPMILMSGSSEREIVDLMLNDLFKRLNERQLKIEVTDAAKDYLAKEGYSETYGARPLRRVIQKKVEDVLAEEILTGNYQPNDELVMDMKDDKIVIEKKQ